MSTNNHAHAFSFFFASVTVLSMFSTVHFPAKGSKSLSAFV